MKIEKNTKHLIFGIFAALVLFSAKTTHAEVCVQPVPPVANKCYKTVTTENQVDQDSRYIYIEKITKQVDMNCGPSSDQIKYEAEMLSYKVCLQVNELKSKNLSQESHLANTLVVSKRVCAYPIQPSSQVSQAVIATAEFGNGTTIKQYADGSYGIFNVAGQYEGIGNVTIFDGAKKYQEVMDKIAASVNSNNLENIKSLTVSAKIYSDMGESLQIGIDKKLADGNNCPNTKIKTPLEKCVSYLGLHNKCRLSKSGDVIMECEQGYTASSTDGCVPKEVPIQEDKKVTQQKEKPTSLNIRQDFKKEPVTVTKEKRKPINSEILEQEASSTVSIKKEEKNNFSQKARLLLKKIFGIK